MVGELIPHSHEVGIDRPGGQDVPNRSCVREQYRATRLNALGRAIRVPSEHAADFKRLREQLEHLADLPANVPISDRMTTIVTDWNARVPGKPSTPMYLWQMIQQEREWGFRQNADIHIPSGSPLVQHVSTAPASSAKSFAEQCEDAASFGVQLALNPEAAINGLAKRAARKLIGKLIS